MWTVRNSKWVAHFIWSLIVILAGFWFTWKGMVLTVLLRFAGMYDHITLSVKTVECLLDEKESPDSRS